MNKNKSIVLGLSGGVDSSVSAYLLKKEGYDVQGVFMKNWEEDDTEQYCHASLDIQDAQNVCDILGINFHRINFSKEYWNKVFQVFLKEYRKGHTPNPDILCNREIKFKAFMEYAKNFGSENIATGHYAHIQFDKKNSLFNLCRAKDLQKDQTYFLYTLTQEKLSKITFPLGQLQKSQVRKIASDLGFLNHAKKDSTGICFIGERKFKDFLQNYCQKQKGKIVSINGKTLGEHDGLMFYTLGQRQGLGIGGQKGEGTQPWYVVNKNLQENLLIVAQGKDHPALYKNSLLCSQMNWIIPINKTSSFKCTAKIRYCQKDESCEVFFICEDQYKVCFTKPTFAITPGQSIVFYQEEICLGGGVIESASSE